MKHTIQRKAACFMLVALFLCSISPSVGATMFDIVKLSDSTKTLEDGAVQQSVVFRSLDKDAEWPFDNIISSGEDELELQNIEYSVTSTATSRVEYVQTVETTRDLYAQDVPSQIAYTVPETGATAYLPLISAEYTETTITGRTGQVTGTVDYGYLMHKPQAAPSATMEYLDTPSGRTVIGTMYLNRVTTTEPAQWRDTDASMTFEGYGGQYFLIPGMTPGDPNSYVEIDSDVPNIVGREEALIRLLNLDPDLFKILSIEWNGDARQENGVTVRDAILHCQQYAARYAANYSAEWQLPDCKGWNATATYGGNMDVLGGTPEYTITTTATYVLPTIISIAAKVLIGAAVVVVAGVIFLILFLVRRRRKDNNESAPYNPRNPLKVKERHKEAG